jgi:hypothetical protein
MEVRAAMLFGGNSKKKGDQILWGLTGCQNDKHHAPRWWLVRGAVVE